MRLLVATPLYPPDLGGPATYAKILEDGLPGLGMEVVLAKFGDVRRLPKVLRHAAYAWSVMQKARGVDAILALDPVSVGLPALCAARLTSTPFFVKIVGDYAWEQGVQRYGVKASLDEFTQMARVPFGVSVLRMVQVHVAKGAKQVIVPSEYLKGIVEAWGIAPEKISVIYNAVEVPEKDGVPSGTGYAIVTVGRLVPWKGMKEVIDAFAKIRTQHPDATLAIVGEGPERARLEAHAKEVAPEGVTFLGAQTHDSVLEIIRQSKVFVLNSTYEGLSHVLIEALLLGRPIVATRAGGNAELIRDGENGLLVSVGDTAALAEAVGRILSDDNLAARLGEHARASRGRFTVDRMLSETQQLIEKSV